MLLFVAVVQIINLQFYFSSYLPFIFCVVFIFVHINIKIIKQHAMYFKYIVSTKHDYARKMRTEKNGCKTNRHLDKTALKLIGIQ